MKLDLPNDFDVHTEDSPGLHLHAPP
jgi:hypothetical protein